jgi:hypothetical protein
MTAPDPTAPPLAKHRPSEPAGSSGALPGAGRWPAGPAWLAAPAVLASPESTGATGMKFVGVVVGLALIWAAIRAMFGRKR